jgi:serine protease Do
MQIHPPTKIFSVRCWPAVLFVLSLTLVLAAPATAITKKVPPPGAPSSFADLVEKLGPTVVNINTTSTVRSGGGPTGQMPFRFFGNDEFFQRFFGDMPEREFKQKSLGSGFIISKDGYILTNNHVIAKADKIRVKLTSGKEYDAEIKGRDPNTDLALIKIETKETLPTVILGDSDKLRVGDWVFAIGNPFGLEHTVTAGIVSAKGRVIGSGPYDNFIQTDTSINPGNSGGPLFNLAGEVVGVNTAMIAQAQGIGFAVPVNMAKSILEDLKTKGSVVRGWLGVSIQEITPDIAENLKLKDNKGALVGQVFEGDPADKAGIKTGDVIVAIDGRTVANTNELLRIVAALPVGKKVPVKILRNGEEKTLTVEIAQRKEAQERAKGKTREFLGMTVQEITPEMARHFNLPQKAGVIVTDVKGGSPAEEGGVRTQDIILQVNRTKIGSLKDFADAMKKARKGRNGHAPPETGGLHRFVTIRPDKK